MKRYVIIVLIFVFLAFKPALADGQIRTLESVGILSGYGWGTLKLNRDYRLYPTEIDFNLNLKKLTQKIGLNPPILIQFQLSAYAAGISEPRSNAEVGGGFALKVGLLPQSFFIQPYAAIGAGMLYMSLHTYEQGTQFNFYEYGGAGLHWFINKNLALTAEYRFRHLSNSGIKGRNSGINTEYALAGLTYKF